MAIRPLVILFSEKRFRGYSVNRILRVSLLTISLFFSTALFSQVFTIDFSAKKDTVTTTPSVSRDSSFCAGNNCVKFDIKLNSGSDLLNLEIISGAVPGGALYYQIDCNPTQYTMATPVCVSGRTSVSITFCKPGNNQNEYRVTASTIVKASADITLRQNCSGTLSVSGLNSGATWTSVFPGTTGQYNSYLSSTSGSSISVTPTAGSPSYIDYRVSGQNTCLGISSDTVRVYTTPILSIPITPANPAICSGASVALTTTPSGGNAPYTYAWSFNSVPIAGATAATYTANAIGTYSVSVNDNTVGCGAVTQSVTVSAASTPVAPTAAGTTICAGTTATLTANAPGGTYRWYDAASGGNLLITNASYTTPILNATTTYYVETTVSACASTRTAVTVTVTPTPVAPTAAGTTICAGNAATLTATAPGETYDWYDAASGGTNLITNASYTTPILNATTTYYVQSTSAGCPGPRTAVAVTVTPIPAAPTAAGAGICVSTTATLTATAPGGIYKWYDAASAGTLLATSPSYTTPVLNANTTYYVETNVSSCISPRTAVTVTATPAPAAPTADGATICAGSTATLTATAPGGTYQWYDAASGGNFLITNTSYTTPALSTNTTYYVQSTASGCIGPRTAVAVSVNPIPAAPTAAGATICAGTTATLTATGPGGLYQWYDAASGGNLLVTNASYTTATLNATTTYYVQTTVSSCAGARTPVTVSVTQLPAAPNAAGTTICASGSASLTATLPGGTYQWYDAASAGNLLVTSATYTTPVLTATTTYYVQSTINGCTGSRSAVTVNVNPIPAAPTASGASICTGNSTTLAATAPGGSYRWYDAASGGGLLASTAAYTTPVLTGSTTYYVETTLLSCTSARTPVIVTVAAAIPAPTATGGTICAGNTTVLTATAPGGSYQWFDAASGGNLLSSNSSYTTPVLNSSTNYYVQATVSGCTSPRTAVSVTVNTVPAAPTASGAIICAGNTTTLTAATSGGTYQWYDAATGGNLLIANASYTTPALSSSTTYYVQSTAGGCTGARTAVNVTVNPIPAAPTANPASLCTGTSTTLTATAPGGSYRWYDAASGGNLLASNASYTTPVLNATTTYFIETTVASCVSARTAVPVTVSATLPVPTVANAGICAGTTAVLTATAPGGTYQWYDAASGGNLLNTGSSYTTPVLNSSKNYFVQATVSGCSSARANVSVTVSPIPAAPTTAGTTICAGNTTSLTATAPGGTYQWFDAATAGNLLASGATYTTPVLTSNTTYYVQSTSGGCSGSRTAVTVTVNPIPAPPTVNPASACTGTSTTVTAIAPGGSYRWYDAASGGTLLASAANYTTPILNSTTNYYVETTIASCTGPRATVTVTVAPSLPAPTAANGAVCAGKSTALTATAPGGTYEWFDAPSGGTLLATNTSYTTPTLFTSATYYVQATVSGCTSSRTAVSVVVNPEPTAPTANAASICIGTAAALAATAPGGTYQWYDALTGGNLLSSTANYTTPVLSSNATYYVQSTIAGCTGARTAVAVTVNPKPAAPTVPSVSICEGNTATISVTTPSGTYQWFDAASGGNLLSSNSSYTTAPLSANAIYYAESLVSGCSSNRTAVTVTVNQIPPVPTAVTVNICTGTTATLSVTPVTGTAYQWYDAARGGNLVASSATFTTSPLASNTSYYVEAIVSGCSSARTTASVSVNPVPAAPTSSGTTICAGSATSLTATAPGGSYQWFDVASGGTSLMTNPNFITPILNTSTTYYVQATVAGCTGPRSAVTVTVRPTPSAPVTNDAAICAGNAINLLATAPGGSYQWFDAATGGNLLANNAGLATPVLTSTTTFYVQTTEAGCTSQRTAVTVTVTPIPAAPVATPSTICQGTSTVLTATAPGGLYQWYDAAVSGNLLSSSAAYTTPVLLDTTSFYVQSTINGCTSPRSKVTVTVLPIKSPAFNYASGTFCVTGTNPIPAIYGTGGVFSSSPAGLVFNSITTGEINLAASALGTYRIKLVTSGACVYASTANITITNSPDATFSYSGPYCQWQAAPSPAFVAGASAGIFSASPAGLNFISISTGEINLNTSAPGTYTVTNNIPALGGCSATNATGTVVVNRAALVMAGPNQTVCAGATVDLAGTIGGSATGAKWSGGKGTFASTSSLITKYTPAAGELIAKLYLTSVDPTGPCDAVVDSLAIFVIPAPAAPSVLGSSICTGNSTTLVATSSGGTFQWFDVATGGTPLGTAQVLTTPVLTTQTIYYVQSIVNGCAGPRTAVTVNVNAKPVITSPAFGSVCSGSPVKYVVNSDIAGTNYSWSRSATAGLSNPEVAGSGADISEILNNLTTSALTVKYVIVPEKSGCQGAPLDYLVTVNPTPSVPVVTSSSPTCVGTPLYLSTNAISGASYSWTGPDSFTSTIQSPVIANITLASAGNYSLVITVNGCSSQPGTKNIFPVIAVPVAGNNSPVCEGNTVTLSAGSLAGASYYWSGPGGYTSTLQNPTFASVKPTDAGVYYVTASIVGCAGLTDSTKVIVSTPPSTPMVSGNNQLCIGDSIALSVNKIPGAVYQWAGPNGFSSFSPTPVIPKAVEANSGNYVVTVSTIGCSATKSATATVVISPIPATPLATSNSPICEGGNLSLFTPTVGGVVYRWVNASGFASSLQGPTINNVMTANAGTYSVTVSLNGCNSKEGTTNVVVVKPAVVTAGPDQTVCSNNATVQLNGTLSGDDTKTIRWSTDGTGSFVNSATLSTTYIPSGTDTAKGNVLLRLATTNNRLCAVSTSSLSVTIIDAPTVNAGPDVSVCSNDSLITLNGIVTNSGGVAIWSTSGTGSFSSPGSRLSQIYTPSKQDILGGNVSFYLVATGDRLCQLVRDTVRATILAAPYVNAGVDRIMFQKDTLVFVPDVRGTNLQYLWLPPDGINNNTIKNAVLVGRESTTFTLRVTGQGSCVAEDQVFIKVLKPIEIPNVFSPNGDGIHDTWEIPQLSTYPGATVEIFTRTGQRIFYSEGYSKPWDGTFNGKPVPVATYYYIVNPVFLKKIFSGSVTVLR